MSETRPPAPTTPATFSSRDRFERPRVRPVVPQILAERIHADRPELRPVPVADGICPFEPCDTGPRVERGAPLAVRWEERRLDCPEAGQYRLTVPMVGGAPPAGAGRRLSRLLDRRWDSFPSTGAAPRITSALALFTEDRASTPDCGCSLVVLITTDGPASRERIDDARLAIHLRAALRELQRDLEAEAGRRPIPGQDRHRRDGRRHAGPVPDGFSDRSSPGASGQAQATMLH